MRTVIQGEELENLISTCENYMESGEADSTQLLIAEAVFNRLRKGELIDGSLADTIRAEIILD